MKFLDALALQICNAKHPALHRVEIIFPAVRPVAPFLHALSRRLGKPSLAPACHALEEWAYKCSGLRRPNRLHLISLLHQAYLHAVKQDGSVPDKPEQFLAWASGLLGDFEEVDSYVLPSEAYPFPPNKYSGTCINRRLLKSGTHRGKNQRRPKWIICTFTN